MPSNQISPTVRRIRLGIELRRLREDAELTIEQVAEQLDMSDSKLSRLETGKGVAYRRDVRALLGLYGLADERQWDLLLTLAKEAQQEGWWAEYEDVLPAGFETYVGLETEAIRLQTYETHVVPGLLETEDYARALLGSYAGGGDVERLAELRMKRQELLTREEDPVLFWAVLDEAVLRRQVGGAAVMRAQLHRIVEMSKLPNVTVQVLPFARGAHAGMNGPFTVIELPEEYAADVVYTQGTAGNVYLEKRKDVRRHKLIAEQLHATALALDESEEFVARVAREMT